MFTIEQLIRLLFCITSPRCPKSLGLHPVGEFNFQGHTLVFAVYRYAYVGAPLCIRLARRHGTSPNDTWYEPWSDLTMLSHAPRGCSLKPGEIHVKTYDENTPLRQPILDTGFFEDSGERTPSGYIDLEVWRVTDAFLQAFASAHQLEIARFSRELAAAA